METVSFPFYQQFLAYDPFSKGRLLFAKVATGGSGSFKSDFVRKHNLKLSSAGYEYVPAQLVESKSWWYIEFYVWDVQKEQLVRKRVGAGRAGSIRERRKKALLKVAQINALLADGYAIDVSKQVAPSPIRKAVSLGEALEQAATFKMKTGGLRSQQGYRSFMNVFEVWARQEGLWRLNVVDFSASEVFAFLDYLAQERELKNKSINNYLINLKALFNAMVEREVLVKSPATKVKLLKTKSESNYPYTTKEQEVLEAYLQQYEPRLYLFTRLIYFAFLRPVEICRLRRRNVQLGARMIILNADQSKNAKHGALDRLVIWYNYVTITMTSIEI